MMQAFGTDQSSFQQPNSVYKVNNDLYIRGVGSADVPPPVHKSNNLKTPPDNGKNKDVKKHKQEDKQHKQEVKKHKQEDKKHKQEDKKHQQKEEKHKHG
jgi:penicillin-binding protein 1A